MTIEFNDKVRNSNQSSADASLALSQQSQDLFMKNAKAGIASSDTQPSTRGGEEVAWNSYSNTYAAGPRGGSTLG